MGAVVAVEAPARIDFLASRIEEAVAIDLAVDPVRVEADLVGEDALDVGSGGGPPATPGPGRGSRR
jgi:hypothetical protein